MNSTIAIAALAAFVLPVAAHAAPPINGRYLTEDGAAMVEVARCGQQLCGKIARVLKAKPGSATTDINNKDAALRNRPIVGMAVLSGFVDKGDDWRGKIYDPRNGKSYKSIVTRNGDGSLKVQGCVAFLCKTQTWKAAR